MARALAGSVNKMDRDQFRFKIWEDQGQLPFEDWKIQIIAAGQIVQRLRCCVHRFGRFPRPPVPPIPYLQGLASSSITKAGS